MSDLWIAILLGIIEGLTEFLPVSSTAHLRIAQSKMGLPLEDEFWKMFAVVIQAGAILAVVAVYWKKILGFVKAFSWKKNDPVILVSLSFLVTAIPAFLLSKVIGENLENIQIMGGALLVGGFAMLLIDRVFVAPKTHSTEEMTLTQAIGIGLIQILSAVFPGTSRSMSTIAGGQILGLSRAAALEFSFLVSIPTMFAATSYDLLKTLKAGLVLTSEQWQVLGVGFVVSFGVALAVVVWFLAWVRKRGFWPFALYRIALGLYLLLFSAVAL